MSQKKMIHRRSKAYVATNSLLWCYYGVLRFIFGVYAFIRIGHYIRPEAKWERERGLGSGKVRESGLEFGTPKAHRRYMSACCPIGADIR